MSIFFERSVAMALLTAATVLIALVMIASSLVTASFGIAIAARIPITTITNTSSTIVNAFLHLATPTILYPLGAYSLSSFIKYSIFLVKVYRLCTQNISVLQQGIDSENFRKE